MVELLKSFLPLVKISLKFWEDLHLEQTVQDSQLWLRIPGRQLTPHSGLIYLW